MREITDGVLIVDGETILTAKEMKVSEGYPEKNFHVNSTGGIKVVSHSLNYDEALGKVTVTLNMTKTNSDFYRYWQKKGALSVHVLDKETGYKAIFRNMEVTEDVEYTLGEEFEVTFGGDAMIGA